MLLVVGIIAILSTIVVVAINPGKQLATANNTVRKSDLVQISNAMQQYFIDHYSYPASTTPTTLTEICNTGNHPYPSGVSCGSLIDLSALVPTYISQIPVDPSGSTLTFINNLIPKAYASTNGTGYKIAKDQNNKIILTAPEAQLGAMVAIGTTTATTTGGTCTATGGTITEVGSYKIHTFTTDGTFTVTSGSCTVDVLVVAGGGSGSWSGNPAPGGGGGAGGVIYNSSYLMTAGAYLAVVGEGGVQGVNGDNSTFGDLTAIGGGHGGDMQSGLTPSIGGSGGAGGYSEGNPSYYAGAAGTAGQ